MDDHVHGTYNLSLVLLSIVVSVFASYSALNIAERVVFHKGRSRTVWIVVGSCVMGLGIWSMHFIGMLAFHYSFEVRYDSLLVIVSMVLPICAAFVALWLVTRNKITNLVVVLGGLFMGLAITGMHYTGMAAMIIPAEIKYNPFLVVLSLLIALVASFFALMLSFHFRVKPSKSPQGIKIIGGLLFGVAIAGMHYTGMYAAEFVMTDHLSAGKFIYPQVNNFTLAFLVGAATIFILLLIIFSLYMEQKLAAGLANLNERRYNFIFEHNPDIVCLFDRKGQLQRVNPAVEKAMGYNEAELPHLNIVSLIHPQDRFRVLYAFRKVAKGQSQTIEFSVRHKQGEFIHLSTTFVPLFVKGTITDIYTISKDMTVRKQIEMKLLEATYTKNQFLANMSHEIRTPLNAIVGMSHLVLTQDVSEKSKDYIRRIQTASRSLSELISDILDFSKIEAGKMELEAIPFDLHKVVRDISDIISLNAAEKELELFFFVAGDVPNRLVGDSFRLRQVLINLLNNAVKFTDSGEIVTRIEVVSQSYGKVKLQFSVKDTGIGLSEEHKLKLFQSFSQADGSTTRKYGGTGLGLAICQQIVQLMNGDIRVESEPGEGSTFYFTAEFNQQDRISLVDKPQKLDHNRILVVVQNRTIRELIHETLGHTGAFVTSVRNSFLALRELEARAPAFDLILLDWNTDKESGLQVTGKIGEGCSALRRIPLILMSHCLQHEEVEVCLKRILTSCSLEKPLLNIDLLDKIHKALLQGEERGKPKQIQEVDRPGFPLSDRHEVIRNARILIVEDNEASRLVYRGMLERYGAILHIVHNGKEAVKTISNFPIHYFDMILMDLQMPEMDGYRATELIRTYDQEVPIIAISAFALLSEKQKCLNSGMNDFISKPIDLESLLETITKWIVRDQSDHETDARSKTNTAPAFNSEPRNAELDPEQLDLFDFDLLAERLHSQKQLIYQVLETYRAQHHEFIVNIREDIQNHRYQSLQRHAHNLKGVAGNLCLNAIYDHAHQLYEASIRLHQAEIEQVSDKLIYTMNLTLQEIGLWLDRNRVSVRKLNFNLNQHQLIGLIDELDSLLVENNMASQSVFAQISAELHEMPALRKEMGNMESSIRRLNYKEARKTLLEVKKLLRTKEAFRK